eukprot:4948194-Prymnesium_polylepis.1
MACLIWQVPLEPPAEEAEGERLSGFKWGVAVEVTSYEPGERGCARAFPLDMGHALSPHMATLVTHLATPSAVIWARPSFTCRAWACPPPCLLYTSDAADDM